MFIPLLAVASMFMVSDRDAVWNSNEISPKTQFASADEKEMTSVLNDKQVQDFLFSLKGKKILMLVHGLDIMPMRPLSYYFDIQANVNGTSDTAPYDYIIGYLWPCLDQYYYYFSAKERANEMAPRFRSLMQKFKHHGASQIDVVAHSMGNKLVLDSVNFAKNPKSPNLIHRFFSVAPAIADSCIDKSGVFYQASQNCDQMYVFYSLQDSILKWEFPFLEWKQALGYLGDSYPRELSPHIQMIDCTETVETHEGYLYALPVFNYIQQTSLNPQLSPEYVQDVLLHGNGTFDITRTRQ